MGFRPIRNVPPLARRPLFSVGETLHPPKTRAKLRLRVSVTGEWEFRASGVRTNDIGRWLRMVNSGSANGTYGELFGRISFVNRRASTLVPRLKKKTVGSRDRREIWVRRWKDSMIRLRSFSSAPVRSPHLLPCGNGRPVPPRPASPRTAGGAGPSMRRFTRTFCPRAFAWHAGKFTVCSHGQRNCVASRAANYKLI